MRTTALLWTIAQLAYLASPLFADDPKSIPQTPGELVKIPINQPAHPMAYFPRLNDIVQANYTFAVNPGSILDNLLVTIDGDSLALAGVARTTDPQQPGAAAISAFLVPKSSKLAKVTFTPVCNGKPGRPIAINFLPSESTARATGSVVTTSLGPLPRKVVANFSAFQVPGGVLLVAQGEFPTTEYQAQLKRLPIRIWPPQFKFEITQPSAESVTMPVVQPYRVTAFFAAKQLIKSVVIDNIDGLHTVPVEQVVPEQPPAKGTK